MVASKHHEERVYPSVLGGVLRIDNQGRIWRGARRAENTSGKYMHVRVMRDGIRYQALAHRLVWLHFFGPIPGGLCLNHKNGQRHDNRPENLEIVTHRGNTAHAISTLKRHGALDQRGEKNHRAKLTAEQVADIRQRRKLGETLVSIGARYNVTMQTVSKIARGDRWA